MDLVLNHEPGSALLHLEGRFTYESHSAFRSVTQSMLDAPAAQEIILDLSGLNYLDSSSLGMLLLLKEKADPKGIQLILQKPSPVVMGILKVVQFGKLFEIREG